MESWGLKKNNARICYKIGAYVFDYEDIIHGIFRGNKPKPGAYMAPFSSGDHKNNLLSNPEPRILCWMFDDMYHTKFPANLTPLNTENLNQTMENKLAAWVADNVKIDSFCNEIILPRYLKDYLCDFDGHEVKLLKLLMKYYKNKYIKNNQVLSDYHDGDLFISFEEGGENRTGTGNER